MADELQPEVRLMAWGLGRVSYSRFGATHHSDDQLEFSAQCDLSERK